jgi:hypothetical protein
VIGVFGLDEDMVFIGRFISLGIKLPSGDIASGVALPIIGENAGVVEIGDFIPTFELLPYIGDTTSCVL